MGRSYHRRDATACLVSSIGPTQRSIAIFALFAYKTDERTNVGTRWWMFSLFLHARFHSIYFVADCTMDFKVIADALEWNSGRVQRVFYLCNLQRWQRLRGGQ